MNENLGGKVLVKGFYFVLISFGKKIKHFPEKSNKSLLQCIPSLLFVFYIGVIVS